MVALYDGIIRFLYAAIAAVERGDADGRRAAVKRALDIIIHLQARLRMDVGGRPAQSLSEFYAAIFAQILQASQSASKGKFEHAIDCVRNVRDAWREVAKESNVHPASSLRQRSPRADPPEMEPCRRAGMRMQAQAGRRDHPRAPSIFATPPASLTG